MSNDRIIIQHRLAVFISVSATVLCLIFNPFYVLILLALVSRYITLPKFLNYIIATSLILSFTNRDIGEGWYADGGFRAQDDALNYISYYLELQRYGLLNTINFSEGKEPLWLTLAYLTGVLSNWNTTALILVSTSMPIILMHKSFNRLSTSFALNTLIFYSFYPEIFHTYYHLWRFSLALSILSVIVSFLISKQKEELRLLKVILPILSHLSALLPVSWIVFIKCLPENIKKNGLVYILSLFLIPLSIITLFIFVVDQIDFEKFTFYIKTAEASVEFKYSPRHFLYILLSLLLIFYSKNKFTVGFAVLGFSILLIPAFLSFVPIIYERIMLTTTPILLIIFIGELSNRGKFESSVILLISIFLFVRSSYILDGTLFYKFIADGNFYSPLNGIIYNLYNLY